MGLSLQTLLCTVLGAIGAGIDKKALSSRNSSPVYMLGRGVGEEK